MSTPLAETFVRIRPDTTDLDATIRRLRDLFADLTKAFDAYLDPPIEERLDEIIDRANRRHDDE